MLTKFTKYIDYMIPLCLLLALSFSVAYYTTQIQPLEQRIAALQQHALRQWRTDIYMGTEGATGGVSRVAGSYHIKLDAQGMSIYNISKYNRTEPVSILCMRISTGDAKDISDAIFAVYGGK